MGPLIALKFMHPLSLQPAAPVSDQRAEHAYARIVSYLSANGAKCLLRPSGEPCLMVGNEHIPLNWDRGNLALAQLLNQVVGMGTLTTEARLTIQRLQLWARRQADSVQFRSFAALENGRLYVPLLNGRLLVLSREGIADAEKRL